MLDPPGCQPDDGCTLLTGVNRMLDSPGGVNGMLDSPQVTREKGVTRPDDASPRNGRRIEPKCSGPSLHEGTERGKQCAVRRLRGSRP